MSLTVAQLAEFIENGAVTVRTPLSDEELRRCGQAMKAAAPQREGATRTGRTCDYYHPEILHVVVHPWLESVAKQTLSTDAVTLFQTALLNAWPDAAADRRTDLQQMDGYHTDMQYTYEDLHATPRRMQVSFFLWVSNVPLGRANLMFRPGTHRMMAQAWSRRPGELGDLTPRIVGKNWRADDFPSEVLQALPPAQPVVATAGDVTVLTTGAVHSASPNFTDGTRQCLVITFTPANVEVGLPPNQAEAKRAYDVGLRQRLPPDRQHIVAGPSNGENNPYGRHYYCKWLESVQQAPRL